MLLVTSSLTSSSASGSLPAPNIPAECSARRADPAARGIGSRNSSMAIPGDASIQGWTYPFGQLPTQFSGLFDVAARAIDGMARRAGLAPGYAHEPLELRHEDAVLVMNAWMYPHPPAV